MKSLKSNILSKGYATKSLFILIFQLLFAQYSFAQVQNPVQINTILTPPYSPFFSDLYKPGGKGLIVSLVFKDFTEPSWDIKLRIRIEGNSGLTLVTNPDIAYNPITIYPGVPLSIDGDDWSQYLEYNNLKVESGDASVLKTRGVLPEGLYTFCVEALDARSGKLLSNNACASGQFLLGGIPQVITPKGNYILPSIPQNIIFQWIMTAPPLNPATTEYKLLVYEITTEGVAPEVAIKSDNALKVYESEPSPNLQLTYDASATNLELGKKYVYQVKVQDKNGEALFRNNGFSEPGWFMYGYPTGGKVELTKPEPNYQFSPKDQQLFKWTVADNKATPSQPISYYLKVVKIEPNDTNNLDEAFKTKEIVYEETTRGSTSNTGWETLVKEEFEKEKWFLWKVDAFSGEQKIAESKVQKFKGKPLLEKFMAGDHEVVVLNTQNNNLNKLTGKGQVKLDKDGNKKVEVDFKDIKIKKLAENVFVLESGELYKEISDIDKIEIKNKDQAKGSAFFTPNAVKLDKNLLRLRGTMEVPLDIVLDGDAAKITSNNTWVDYNTFRITGGVKVSGKYDLMEPMNFTILLDTNTTMIMGNTGYDLYYYGSIGLPESSQNAEGKRIVLPFVNLKELTYLELDSEIDRLIIPPYRPIPNTNLLVYPKRFVIDFSDKKSPANFPKDWKGAYIPKFDLVFKPDFDVQKRITFNDELKESFDLSENTGMQNHFKSTGLFFNYKKDIDPFTKVKFNAFSAKPGLFEVNIENGVVKSGIFNASIDIPILSDTKKYKVFSKINNEGFIDGILEEKLEGKKIIFSEKAPESKGEFTIKRAKFSDANCIDLAVDVAVPALRIAVNNQSGFKIFGNHQIGFEKPNGECDFEKEMVGVANGVIEVNIGGIGAAFMNGKYLYYMKGALNISDDFSGPAGEPLSNNFYGSIEVNSNLDIQTDYVNKPKVPISSAVLNTPPDKVKSVDKLDVELNTPVASMAGTLEVKKNDPEWGTVFTGTLTGFVYAPTKIKAGSSMIVGKASDGTKYWFFEAFAKDDGIGYPIVPGVINAVGIEGKIYGNMSAQVDKKTKAISMKIDKKVKFGGALYMQLIDAASNGVNVKADVGLEMKYVEGDFQLAMQAEGTFINLNGRSVVPADVAAVAAPITQQAVGAAINEINKQSVKIGDWTFNADIKTDLTQGGLKGKNGNTSMSFGANVSKKYGYFNFEDQDWKLDISGNSTTKALAFNMDKKTGSVYGMGLAYFPGDSASFRYSQGAKFGISGGFQIKKKLGQFSFNYDDVKLAIMSDLSKQAASIELKPTKDFRIFTALNRQDQSGSFELNANGHTIAMAAARSGYAKLKYDKTLEVLFDKEKKDGKLELNTDGNQLLLQGNPQGGEFKFVNTNYNMNAGISSSDGKGFMKFIQGSDRSYIFDLDTKNQSGLINIQEGDKTFALGAGKAQGAALFKLQIPNLTINTEANVKNSTGFFELKKDNNNYLATLNADSAVFSLDRSDLKMKVAGFKNKSGALAFSKDDINLYVQGNAEGKGLLRFNNEDIRLFALGEKAKGMGALSLKYKGADSLNLFLDNSAGKGRFAGLYGNRFVSGYLDKSGRGGIRMDMPEFNVELAGDKAGYGKIYFNRTQDNILIDVQANKSSLDGSSRVIIGSDSVVSGFDLNIGRAELKSAVQGTIVNGYIDKDGVATAYYKAQDREMNANVTPKGINTLLYTQPQLRLSAEGNKPNMNAKMSLNMDSDSIRANFDKQTQVAKLDATFSNYSIGANVQNKEGTGDMYYFDETHKVKVQGDKSGNGKADYEDGEQTISIMADKVKSNLDVTYIKGSDSIYTATREKKRVLGRISIDNIKTSFDIAKDGDKSFAFSDNENLFNVLAKTDKTIIFNSTIKKVSVNAHSHADGRKLLYYKNNSDSLSAQIDPKGDKVIKAFLDNNLLDVQHLKSGDKSIHFVTGIHDFTASKTAINQLIDYKFDSKRLKIDKETLLINNGNHELLLKSEPNKKRLFIDGKEVTLSIGNPFDFEGMSITYLVEGQFHFLRVKTIGLPSFDVGFNELGLPNLSVKFPDFDLAFKGIALGFDFNFGGFDLKFPDVDFLKFNLPGLGINFKGFDLDFDIEDAIISFPGKYTFDLKWKKDFNFNINLEKVKIGINRYYFAFDVLQNLKFEFPDASVRWFSYNINTDIFALNFDKFKFNYEPLKLLSFAYDTKFFKLFDTGIELGFDSKLLAFEINKHLKFNFEPTKYFRITPINMSMDWDKVKFGISMDSLRFAFLPIKLDIVPDLLKLDINGKILSLDALRNLKFYYDPTKIFTISPLVFKINWGKYGVSFGKLDPLSFTDGLRNFKISGDFLSLSDLDLDLKYNFGQDLAFKYKADLFSISLDKISGKWGKFDFGFGKIDGITFNYDKYKFQFKDILRLDIDGRWMAYHFTTPKIELNYPDIKFGLNGWLDQINFNFEDYNLSLGKIDGLKYWDKLNMFSFGDDLLIKTSLADFSLGIKGLKLPEKLFYFNMKGYDLSFNALKGIKFTMPDAKWFNLGLNNNYSFSWDGYEFGWMKDYLKFSTPDYGIIYGGERIFGITHKKSELSLMKDYAVKMMDDGKGAEINGDGIITLFNNGQQIVAGGDQPIKFKDANGMDMKDGSSDGFKFNVAGMDFDVKANEDNNVTIETNQKFGTIAIESQGEGLMTATLKNGNTKYGTLYKNKYTWGLAVGNEKADSGPQATQNIQMTGPSKIGKITTNSTSILQAIAYASFSTKTGELYINGQVTATKPFMCIENGTFSCKFSKDDFYIKVAEPDKMASLRPLCMGLETKGYLHLSPRRYAAGISHGYRFELSGGYSYSELGVTVVSIEAGVKFGYLIEGEAIVVISKDDDANIIELEKLRIKVEGDASAYLSGKVFGVGGTASMGVYVGGEMILIFTKREKSFEGKLKAGFEFLGEDFDIDFKAKIAV